MNIDDKTLDRIAQVINERITSIYNKLDKYMEVELSHMKSYYESKYHELKKQYESRIHKILESFRYTEGDRSNKIIERQNKIISRLKAMLYVYESVLHMPAPKRSFILSSIGHPESLNSARQKIIELSKIYDNTPYNESRVYTSSVDTSSESIPDNISIIDTKL